METGDGIFKMNTWRNFALVFFRGAAGASLLLSASVSTLRAVDRANVSLEAIAPITAPFAMPQLKRPVFPARVVDIRDHGAVDGGEVKNTQAFASAIAACATAGGGRVLVPEGRWLTGPIHFKSNIELHLAAGSEIIFSDTFEDYLPVVRARTGGVEIYNYSPLVYARDCENVAITGPGTLNGNGRAWWDWKTLETKELIQLEPRGVPVEQRIYGNTKDAVRPNFVVFYNCKNVLFEGFTIGGSPCWTLHPVYCENLIIRRVNVDTDGPNNDGIDPDSCRNVLIEHCTFSTGDDCVVLKSGYNEDGWRVGRATENVVMRHCSSKRGHGGLVIGSEMSGGVRNVYMHDCEFDGTDRAVRIKSRRGRGGVVENITAERLRVKNMKREVVIMNMDYASDRTKPTNEKAPMFRRITVRDVVCEGAPVAIRLTGMEDSLIEDIVFENLTIASVKGVIAQHVKGVSFKNVAIETQSGPVFDLDNASAVAISGARSTRKADVFIKVSGAGSTNVNVDASEIPGVRRLMQLEKDAPPVRFGADVKTGAVTTESK